MKRYLLIILSVLLILAMFSPMAAAAEVDIQPLWVHTNSVYSNLSINENTGIATCSGRVTAKNSVPVELVVHLKQLKNGSWGTLKTWTVSGTTSVSCLKYYAVYSGYTYCLVVTGYVYDSNGVLQEVVSADYTVEY